MSEMKILAFDIEASNLAADFGVVLCVGFKDVEGGKTEVLSIGDYQQTDIIKAEKALLKDVYTKLMEADCWVAHYGRWFDTIFLNTRLLYHRLPLLPPNFPLIDTWKASKNHLKLRSNRLVTIQEFLNLDKKKNAIRPEQWLRALGGHKPSLDYIVGHCRRDVEVLVDVYKLLRPLLLDHPNKLLTNGKGCPTCGKQTLQRRGFRLTRTRRFARFQCQSCGSWSSTTTPEKKVTVK